MNDSFPIHVLDFLSSDGDSEGDREPTIARTRELTDLGNAERLVDAHGDDLRYVPGWGWLTWDGKRWRRDEGNLGARSKAAKVARSIRVEANRAQVKQYKRLASHAARSESAARIDAMVKLSEPKLAASVDLFDKLPFCFNVDNGTVDLSTGNFRQHRRDDFLTQLSPVEYDEGADCPLWKAFLKRIIRNQSTLSHLWKAAGYSLTGDVGAQVMFFLFGSGANGKSTFIETLIHILGDYAVSAPPGLLLTSQNDNRLIEVASVYGKRFVSAQETGEGKRLDEEILKRLTGGDELTGKFLYKDPFNFNPTHKIWLASNHKPTIRSNNHGTWRRLHLIPFTETIGPDEIDPELGQKLICESSGILNWLVSGARRWKGEGLKPPHEVEEAVKEYRSEEDLVGQWFESRVEYLKGNQLPANELYSNFRGWCEEQGIHALSQPTFGRRLGERGLEKKRLGTGIVWLNLKLK